MRRLIGPLPTAFPAMLLLLALFLSPAMARAHDESERTAQARFGLQVEVAVDTRAGTLRTVVEIERGSQRTIEITIDIGEGGNRPWQPVPRGREPLLGPDPELIRAIAAATAALLDWFSGWVWPN